MSVWGRVEIFLKPAAAMALRVVYKIRDRAMIEEPLLWLYAPFSYLRLFLYCNASRMFESPNFSLQVIEHWQHHKLICA